MMYFLTEFIHFIDRAYPIGTHLLTSWAFILCRRRRTRDMLYLISSFILLVIWSGAEELQYLIGAEFQ
jgi:hypothetical protein